MYQIKDLVQYNMVRSSNILIFVLFNNDYYFLCRFNITDSDDLPKCTGNEKLNRRKYKQDSKIQMVYDSVYAMAYALDKLLRDECSNLTDFKTCAKTLKIDGQRFYKEYILNVSFVGKSGHYTPVFKIFITDVCIDT